MSPKKREQLLPVAQRVYARLVSHVAREMSRALAAEERIQGKVISRARLAALIGRDKSFVTRKLSGGENMELRTVAAVLGALGYEMDVHARRIEAASTELSNVEQMHLTAKVNAADLSGGEAKLEAARISVNSSVNAQIGAFVVNNTHGRPAENGILLVISG